MADPIKNTPPRLTIKNPPPDDRLAHLEQLLEEQARRTAELERDLKDATEVLHRLIQEVSPISARYKQLQSDPVHCPRCGAAITRINGRCPNGCT